MKTSNRPTLSLTINGTTHQAEPGISVAAALARCGCMTTRVSVSGTPRAPMCGMGICQECRVTINGKAHQLACQTLCTNEMQILTGEIA